MQAKTREKTMPMLRLILDPEGAAGDVDDAMFIGACATQLAAQLGYPLSDSSGAPVIYQFCLTSTESLLPNDQRFCDLQLVSGTHVTLVSTVASAPTGPVHALGLSTVTQSAPRPRRRWSRRAFLTTGTLAAFAVTGLGTGLTVALAQRYLSGKRADAAPLVSPTTAAPRIVSGGPPADGARRGLVAQWAVSRLRRRRWPASGLGNRWGGPAARAPPGSRHCSCLVS